MKSLLPGSLDVASLPASGCPARPGRRQPVHTFYGGAHLFRAGLMRKLGALALDSLDRWAPDAASFREAFDLDASVAAQVRDRVAHKLETEPVEDYRIDFEDGFGQRSDVEEDEAAKAAASETAAALVERSLPRGFGIRVKSLTRELASRAFRTLDLFLTTLAGAARRIPHGFVVTLPKLTDPAQASMLVSVLAKMETNAGWEAGTLACELMAETPESILRIEEFLAAAGKRCIAVHFGAYDYTATLGISSAGQRLQHPACEFARAMLLAKVAALGHPLALSDGATNRMPVPLHRGEVLTEEQKAANRAEVHRAWRAHYGNVRHALDTGYPQGWDLHPAQLVARYAAVYADFAEHREEAARRLRNFLDRAAQASLAGSAFDDAATGQGLLNFFLRAIGSGAAETEEVKQLTGLTPGDLERASFPAIVQAWMPNSR